MTSRLLLCYTRMQMLQAYSICSSSSFVMPKLNMFLYSLISARIISYTMVYHLTYDVQPEVWQSTAFQRVVVIFVLGENSECLSWLQLYMTNYVYNDTKQWKKSENRQLTFEIICTKVEHDHAYVSSVVWVYDASLSCNVKKEICITFRSTYSL